MRAAACRDLVDQGSGGPAAFIYGQDGTWANGIALALRRQHVYYRTPATLLAGEQQHVFYTGADHNVNHAYRDPNLGINTDQWTFDGQGG